MSDERVILLDEEGNATGTAPKASTHHTDTPLHLAFSCYVFDHAGRLLVTQRALDKRTFPGVWTNSVCGHPAPGETMDEAVHRRAHEELGITLTALALVLPGFRYEAISDNGVREKEMCPVYTARTTSTTVVPRPDEVAEVAWVDWASFRDDVLAGRREVSVWCAAQVKEFAAIERDDGTYPPPDPTALPPAAGAACLRET